MTDYVSLAITLNCENKCVRLGATGFSAPPGASSSSSHNTDSFNAPSQYPAVGYVGGYPNQPNYSWPDPNYPSAPPAAQPPASAASSRPYTAPSAAELAAAASTAAAAAAVAVGVEGLTLSPIDVQQAQKFLKFASSALNFEDVPTAIDNCEKALRLMKTGKQ